LKKGFLNLKRHTNDELYTIGISDLKSINDFIGDKNYLMGDRICTSDASIFAYVTQIISHENGKLHNYLISEFLVK
jgi:hypothetical protein